MYVYNNYTWKLTRHTAMQPIGYVVFTSSEQKLINYVATVALYTV